nr:unnamed protein product [Spirometra erinaceieuropaei]
MSQRSTELNCSDAEELDEGKGFMGVGGTPADMVGSSVGSETEEAYNGVAISDEAPGTTSITPICAIPQGAVFGAPIQTQEQSMQLPDVPHVLAVFIQKLEERGLDSPELYTHMPHSLSLYAKIHLINSYPVDDLARIHPEIFADTHDLAAMITLYVECLPTRLVEGMVQLNEDRAYSLFRNDVMGVVVFRGVEISAGNTATAW